MATKDQIRDALITGKSIGLVHSWSLDASLSHVVTRLIKECGDEWGASGQTGTAKRNYDPYQTRCIIDELQKIIEGSEHRTVWSKAGVTSADILRARQKLIPQVKV